MFAPRNVGKKKVQMSMKPAKRPVASQNLLAPKRSLDEGKSTGAPSSTEGGGGPATKKRKSRWGSAATTTASDTGLFSNLGATTTFVPKAAIAAASTDGSGANAAPVSASNGNKEIKSPQSAAADIAGAVPPFSTRPVSDTSPRAGPAPVSVQSKAQPSAVDRSVPVSVSNGAAAHAPAVPPPAAVVNPISLPQPVLSAVVPSPTQPPLSAAEPSETASGTQGSAAESETASKSEKQEPATAVSSSKQLPVVEPPKPAPKKELDMFGDGDDADPELDMFGDGEINTQRAGIRKRDGTSSPAPDLLAEDSVTKDGYYHVNPGETVHGRYRVVTEIGRGVFSAVLGCVDLQRSSRAVAIKVIKNNETMRKAAEKEVDILRRLAKDDPNGKKHCVSMLSTFEHRQHTCMVFERYEMDLRAVLKKFGRGVGIKLDALRIYGAQLLMALAQMRRLGIVHADIKPDNVLVTVDKRKIVLADFGSAGDLDDCEITPYLVSRYYRAPEISLGHEYGCAIDVWAVACTICEMYTGHFLFDGETNNHMLRLIQEVCGGLSHKMIRQSKLKAGHFDEAYNFLAQPLKRSKDKKVRKMKFDRPSRELFAILCPPENIRKMATAEIQRVQLFKDLLGKMLTLDPAKRPKPEELLGHAFFATDTARSKQAATQPAQQPAA